MIEHHNIDKALLPALKSVLCLVRVRVKYNKNGGCRRRSSVCSRAEKLFLLYFYYTYEGMEDIKRIFKNMLTKIILAFIIHFVA